MWSCCIFLMARLFVHSSKLLLGLIPVQIGPKAPAGRPGSVDVAGLGFPHVLPRIDHGDHGLRPYLPTPDRLFLSLTLLALIVDLITSPSRLCHASVFHHARCPTQHPRTRTKKQKKKKKKKKKASCFSLPWPFSPETRLSTWLGGCLVASHAPPGDDCMIHYNGRPVGFVRPLVSGHWVGDKLFFHVPCPRSAVCTSPLQTCAVF
ncbi:hypothetical protein QR685DRAFT_40756 [Neurospora intermedia]|uniref:Secreted protein n=1 Tax=Neurospora intermedia TaxID=5142 RepID=A0ABR3DRG3_NEUIN